MPSEKSSHTYLRTLLLRRSEWIEERVLAAASRNGYGAVTPAMNRLFGHMRSRPVGLSELARQMGVSRQAVHAVVREAQGHGLVELVDSEEDARVKLVQFTQAGRAMADLAVKELRAIERELATRIGESELERLKDLLALPWSEDERRN